MDNIDAASTSILKQAALKLLVCVCRKKLIEALREGDRDLIASMAQGQEALKSNLEGTSSGVADPMHQLP